MRKTVATTVTVALPGLLFLWFLAGCNKKPTPDFIPDPEGWFIQSYNNGVITVEHAGNTYMANCDGSKSFNNTASVTDESKVIQSPSCSIAIEFVGYNVQPFQGNTKDAGGWTINMWNVGSTLALRKWRDDHTPWQQEEFKIISVKHE